MPKDATRTGKLLSVISAVAITCSLLPGAALSQSQYVTDYGKKPASELKPRLAPPAPGTTGSAPKADKKSGLVPVPANAQKPGTPAATATSAPTTASKPATKTITIVKATKHVAKGGKWEQFADYIILKPGQEDLPLSMTVNNGGDGEKPMAAIRASLAGRELFNEKSFKGKTSLVLDMSDALSAGSTQVVFQAYGAAGSSFTWDLISKSSPQVTGLNPKNAASGATVKATGKMLPADIKSYQIQVGGKPATVTAAAVDGVDFRVPDGLKPDSKGEVPVLITVAGIKAKALTLKVTLEPEIQTFSHISISSQQIMTISGKNFGTDASKVKVTFGGTPGEIMSCSDTSITVRTPEIADIPSEKQVTVEVNGTKCKKNGLLFFSMRNVENSDNYSPFAVPQQFN